MKLRLAKPTREAIGARVRELRRFHNLEQTELARMAGLSQAIISQYEQGLTEISLSFISFLSDKFGTSMEWLVTGKPAAQFSNLSEEYPKSDQKGSVSALAKKRKANQFFQVPVVAPATAARPGAVNSDTILGWQPIPADLFSSRAQLVAVDVKPAWVKNMSLVFRPTGRVVIDRKTTTIDGNHYYAVNEHPTRDVTITAIRRLNRSGSRLWFLEDSPATGSFAHVDLNQRLTIDHIVIGRLVWICRPL